MIIEDFKSGLILDIIIKNLSQAEINRLEINQEIKDDCLRQIQIEYGGRPSEEIAWKNQWKDHIPD